MLMKLQITTDEGEVLHSLESSILNGEFHIAFDPGTEPSDQSGMLEKMYVGFILHMEEVPEDVEEAINSLMEHLEENGDDDGVLA